MIKFDDVEFDIQEDNSVSSPSMAKNESYNLKSEEVDEQGVQVNNIYCSKVHDNVLVKKKGQPPAKRLDTFTYLCLHSMILYCFKNEYLHWFSTKEIPMRKKQTK